MDRDLFFSKIAVLDLDVRHCARWIVVCATRLRSQPYWISVLVWSSGLFLASPASSTPLPTVASSQTAALEELSAIPPPSHSAADLVFPSAQRPSNISLDATVFPETAVPVTAPVPAIAHSTRLAPFASTEAIAISSKAPQYKIAESPLVPTSSLSPIAQDQPGSTVIPIKPGDPNSPNPPLLIQPSLPVPAGCDPDPELGCLQLRQPVLVSPAPRFPVMYLVPRLDFFSSSNILSGVDPTNDGLVRPALTLLAIPQLGPRTFLVTSVEGALNRYLSLDQFNYDELKFRAGISQQLSPNMTAEIGWSNQQLFIASSEIPGFPRGKRFLNDQAIRLEISRRDQLAKNLALNSFYQFRVSFTQPEDRSRIINVVFLSLNYDVTPKLQLGLDYQFASANFTQQRRTDIYHQVLTRLTYSAFRNTQISIYGGLSAGSSTESSINFDGFLLGVSLTVNLVLF